MAIDIRDSRIRLDSASILEIIDPYDIYCYYYGGTININKGYYSPFRKDDTNPSFRLQVGQKGDLRFSDYGLGWFGNCFDFVMKLYDINFNQALVKIDRDFHLGLSTGISFNPIRRSKAVKYKKPRINGIELKIRSRFWSTNDRNYWWGRYRIKQDLLDFYGVKPITHIWVNGDRFAMGSSISYSFSINNHFKIYRPLAMKFKWLSNTKKQDIQGYTQLPSVGPLLIITSSLKDVIQLRALGFVAVAFQSEMMMPSQDIINEFKVRFEHVAVLYDNDHTKHDNPGQTMANKLCDQFKLHNLVIPNKDYENSKDISDLVHHYGISQGYRLIKKLIDYELCIS